MSARPTASDQGGASRSEQCQAVKTFCPSAWERSDNPCTLRKGHDGDHYNVVRQIAWANEPTLSELLDIEICPCTLNTTGLTRRECGEKHGGDVLPNDHDGAA